MSDEKYTRCPGCATVFRVTPEQLALRAGQVRCGQCKSVFDGIAQQVSLSPALHLDSGAAPVEEMPPGTITAALRDAQLPATESTAETAAQPATGEATEEAAGEATGEATGESAGESAGQAAGEAAEPAAQTPDEASRAPAGDAGIEPAAADRFAPVPSSTSRRARLVFYAAATVFLVLLVAAQAAFHFRDAIVTFWPVARPALARLCATAGCAIRPLRDVAMSQLSIEASDLQADPAHRGLLILTATVRSRADWPLAYPHLELTLTDAQDRIVVRRALAPADYAGGTADLQRGIAPNGEIAFKVFIDASATSQAGYRLYMFYP